MTHRYRSTRATLSRLVTICVLLAGTGCSGATGERSSAPTQSSSPSPSPPAASPRVLPGTEAPLQPGTYLVDRPFRIPLTVTTTAGWVGYVGKYGHFAEVGPVYFLIFDKVVADPCDSTKGLLTPQPGPSADDLATALAAMPSVEVTGLSDISIDGYSGKRLDIHPPASFSDCTLTSEGFFLWRNYAGEPWGMGLDEWFEVSILDVAGQRLVIDVIHKAGETSEQQADIRSVLDSIHILPVT
jgi:hypothetical protein